MTTQNANLKMNIKLKQYIYRKHTYRAFTRISYNYRHVIGLTEWKHEICGEVLPSGAGETGE